MRLSPAQLKMLEAMKDKDLVINSKHGAPFLEKNAAVVFSVNTTFFLVKHKLIDSQHEGNWNSGCLSHQITELGIKTLQENLRKE